MLTPKTPGAIVYQSIEPILLPGARDFDRALTEQGIPHTTDLYGCGIHSWRYWQRDLHAFWPLMVSNFGASPPRDELRRADPKGARGAEGCRAASGRRLSRCRRGHELVISWS